MKIALRDEWQQFVRSARSLNMQTAFVLTVSVVLIIVQVTLGDRQLFNERLAQYVNPDWAGVLSWGWWFAVQGLTGFVLPVFFLLVLFKRKPGEIGLGLGDWRLATLLAGIYIPLVVIGTWILSDDPDFRAIYPHYQPAAYDWRYFAVYELLFLFYWIGWEYLWRGFLLFGTAATFGLYSIFIQMIPFAILHFNKPPAEAFLSIAGGLALGALVWRCRSFWIAVPIHAAQMLILDFWCTLRIRTGISGIGPDALVKIVSLF
jgi:uncharacterized protein